MKVQLKTIVAGPMGTWEPGVREIPDELAEKLIAAGMERCGSAEPEPAAEPVHQPAAEPAAPAEEPMTASEDRPRRGRR